MNKLEWIEELARISKMSKQERLAYDLEQIPKIHWSDDEEYVVFVDRKLDVLIGSLMEFLS